MGKEAYNREKVVLQTFSEDLGYRDQIRKRNRPNLRARPLLSVCVCVWVDGLSNGPVSSVTFGQAMN